MSSKWQLEIHDEPKGTRSILSFFEFDDFPSLRLKIVDNRGRKFLVRLPALPAKPISTDCLIYDARVSTSKETSSNAMGNYKATARSSSHTLRGVCFSLQTMPRAQPDNAGGKSASQQMCYY
jgi:hypothetical protein